MYIIVCWLYHVFFLAVGKACYLSSLTRGWTRALRSESSPNHWTTRELPWLYLYKILSKKREAVAWPGLPSSRIWALPSAILSGSPQAHKITQELWTPLQKWQCLKATCYVFLKIVKCTPWNLWEALPSVSSARTIAHCRALAGKKRGIGRAWSTWIKSISPLGMPLLHMASGRREMLNKIQKEEQRAWLFCRQTTAAATNVYIALHRVV